MGRQWQEHVFTPLDDGSPDVRCLFCWADSEEFARVCPEYSGSVPTPLFVAAASQLSLTERLRVRKLINQMTKQVLAGRLDMPEDALTDHNGSVWLVFSAILARHGWHPHIVPVSGAPRIVISREAKS